jgi:1,4-dihydroxy-2-naphthoate octaprenyltransferase
MTNAAKILKLLSLPEPAFLLPGIPSVLTGTALGAIIAGETDWPPAILALAAIITLNAGSNMLNDYFDHLSGNDWLNTNRTKFGGGSGHIQSGLVTPNQMRSAGIISLTIGMLIGVALIILTKSLLILSLGIIGVLGGIFWTMPPVKACYRFPGEPYIFTMFGLLPTIGSFYLQTGSLQAVVFVPAVIIGLLIASVALLNAIGDRLSDEQAGKRTFVVRRGVGKTVVLYRAMIAAAFTIAAGSSFFDTTFASGARAMLFTAPLALICIMTANKRTLEKDNVNLPNALNILLYIAAAAAMTVGICRG